MTMRTRIPARISFALASLCTAAHVLHRTGGPKAECLIQALEPRLLLSNTSIDLGTQNAIAYDAQGTLHVAYYDTSTKSLMYATETQDGVWSAPVTVDNSSSDVGQQVALALGPSGKIGLAYVDAANAQLRFASLSGSTWQTTAIDPKNGLGENPSITFDAKGRAHVSYYRPAAGDLRMATQVSASKWQIASVVGKHKADPFSSLATSSNGQTALAYETTKGQVVLKSGKNGNFSSSKTVAVLPGASELSANFDAKSAPAVSFYNTTTGTIQVASQGTKKNKYVTTAVATTTAGQDPDATLFYNVPASSLQVVYYDSAQDAVFSASPDATGTTYNVTQLGSGGGTTMKVAMVPGTGDITFTTDDPNASPIGGAPTPLRPPPPPLTPPVNVDAIAPSNVAAQALSTSSVKLTWTDNSLGLDTFQVKRSTDNHTFTTVATLSDKTTTWTDTTDAASTTYYYEVYATALNLTVAMGAPAPVSITTPAIPASAPTNVTASAISSATIQLSWTDNSSGQDTFQIKRSTNGGQTFTALATVPAKTNSYSDTGLTAQTAYSYQVIAVAPNNATAMGNPSPVSATTLAVNASNPQYLLTPQMLSTMQAAAANNTPQWQAFKANLNAGLNQVTPVGWEAFQLPLAENYALGYQILKNTDPTTAAGYADKAIAIMMTGLEDDNSDVWGSRMFLSRGDGSTTQFTLPNTGLISGTLKVYSSQIKTVTVTKGAANSQDAVDDFATFLKVSSTPDGSATFTKGVDWRYNTDYAENMIDWSLASSNQPATGSMYYVTEAPENTATQLTTGFTLNGNVITFNTAPAANTAILVQYEYNSPTLKYQQVGDGRGGFNNVFIDTGYTSRNLQYIAVALDWIWSSQDLTQQLRSETMNMLTRWSDYLRDHGYYMDQPSSNYGAGHLAFRMATAIALQNRDATDAPRLMSEMQSYQANYLLPILEAPNAQHTDSNGNILGTEEGGFWAEGWNYGALSVQNILTSELAYENAGWGSAAVAKSWSNDVITSLLEEQPTQSTIYDGGDGYSYPEPFVDKMTLATVAYAATDSTLKSYANWAIQNYAGSVGSGATDLIFRDPNATATFWGNSLPLQYLSPGTGLAVARKDWTYNSTWFAFHSGDLAAGDHQPEAQGDLEINRGSASLLVNATSVTGSLNAQSKSKYGNLVNIDDGGAGTQTYPYTQGEWYGSAGVTMPHFEGNSAFAYMQGNYASAYTKAFGQPGRPDPAITLVRDIFYIRQADYLVVYDRATTVQAQFTKQLQWHFTGTPSITGNGWSVAVGSSKLFGETFSDTTISTAMSMISSSPALYQVRTNNTSPVATVDYVTAMQVTSSTTAAMDSSSHVESSDGKLEGAEIGSYVVLFGKNGLVSGGTSYQVTAPSGQTVTHYISDLAPGVTYTLTGASQASATVDSQGVLTFTTTGSGSAQTIVLS